MLISIEVWLPILIVVLKCSIAPLVGAAIAGDLGTIVGFLINLVFIVAYFTWD